MCDENAECHDTDGSYWCQCRPGFTGDGYNCTGVLRNVCIIIINVLCYLYVQISMSVTM